MATASVNICQRFSLKCSNRCVEPIAWCVLLEQSAHKVGSSKEGLCWRAPFCCHKIITKHTITILASKGASFPTAITISSWPHTHIVWRSPHKIETTLEKSRQKLGHTARASGHSHQRVAYLFSSVQDFSPVRVWSYLRRIVLIIVIIVRSTQAIQFFLHGSF